jgi:hypothetical protein
MDFADLLLLLLRSFFAIPSLQSRDNITGIGENSVAQTYLFTACREGYRKGDRANFMQSWGKPDASMERGWYGLGTAKVRRNVCLVLK